MWLSVSHRKIDRKFRNEYLQLYETAQKAKESRRKSTNVVIKEMKYRPKIGGGDFDTKTRKVEQFLGEGHKVKITIMFRGREQSRPELGYRLLQRMAEEIAEYGIVESSPKQDGRNMTMVLAPHRGAKTRAKAAHDADAPAGRPEPATAPEPDANA